MEESFEKANVDGIEYYLLTAISGGYYLAVAVGDPLQLIKVVRPVVQ